MKWEIGKMVVCAQKQTASSFPFFFFFFLLLLLGLLERLFAIGWRLIAMMDDSGRVPDTSIFFFLPSLYGLLNNLRESDVIQVHVSNKC